MYNKRVERQINKIYNEVYKMVFTSARLSKLAKGDKKSPRTALVNLAGSAKYEAFSKEFAARLAKAGLSKQRGVWKKYYEAAKSAHYVALPKTYKEFEIKAFNKVIKHNYKMIKSIPEKMKKVLSSKYTKSLINEVIKGTTSRGSFEKMLRSHGSKQAKLIARTETAKLQTAMTEIRSKEVGAVAYTWVSSNDKRTRPSHRAMNGVIVLWRKDDEKPKLDDMQGNAGEFPNCRCDAQPIVDVKDLTNSNYKLYDYKQHKVITVHRKQLIEILEKGEI